MANSQPRFADLPPRQKVAVIIFFLILGFIGWEVIGMFRGGGSGSGGGAGGTITPVKTAAGSSTMTAKAPEATKSKPTLAAASPASTPIPAPALPAAPPAAVSSGAGGSNALNARPQAELAPPTNNMMVQQDMTQTKYVSALNELQMLKIQKEIAETSQAIVTAKLATVTAEKSITDVLAGPTISTTPAPPPAPTSVSANPSPSNLPPGMMNGPGGGPPVSYSVHSVSKELDQWHAVVKFKDKFYDVSVGDMLPPDGSLVKAIDGHGVTLEQAGMEQKIPLSMTDAVPGTTDVTKPK